jgi:UDP-GlcNAc:undecaprenyl-phosphate/decaprenyl-phosphate GlcNAc-1-phosphate transferase
VIRAWQSYLINAAVAGGSTFLFGWAYPLLLRPPVKPNYRGVRLPLSLGTAVTIALVAVDIALVPVVAYHVATTAQGVPQKTWVLVAACLAVYAAGTYDDRRPHRTRGVVAQIGALRTGTVTSGVVKLAVLVAASAAWTLITGSSPLRVILGTAVIAGVANGWNLLDVAPGRAPKFAVLAAIPLFAYRPTRFSARIVAASAVALIPDLRERAMLGDAGANVMGFAIGAVMFDRLGNRGLALALLAVVAVHVVSETVTLSRVIEVLPPLRWFDRLGRIRQPAGEGSTST